MSVFMDFIWNLCKVWFCEGENLIWFVPRNEYSLKVWKHTHSHRCDYKGSACESFTIRHTFYETFKLWSVVFNERMLCSTLYESQEGGFTLEMFLLNFNTI